MSWEPPQNFEERLTALLVPPRLHLRYRVARERARGEPELGMVPFLADRDRVSVDVGANRGVWSEVLRHHSSRVHAFEPNPKIYRVLQNCAAPGVFTHRIALSDRNGTGELRIPRGSRGYSNQGASLSAEKIGDADFRSLTVKRRRLDDLDVGDVGFMKIDVEGHELAVMEGARSTLRRCRPNLIVEIEERHAKRPISELLDAVCAHGYEAFALYRGALRRASQIDLAAAQATGTMPRKRIFNWIFLPA